MLRHRKAYRRTSASDRLEFERPSRIDALREIRGWVEILGIQLRLPRWTFLFSQVPETPISLPESIVIYQSSELSSGELRERLTLIFCFLIASVCSRRQFPDVSRRGCILRNFELSLVEEVQILKLVRRLVRENMRRLVQSRLILLVKA